MFNGDPGSGQFWLWVEIVGGQTPAPGMMYLGRAGPLKMILVLFLLIGVDGGGEEGETNGAGCIGLSKMSTHSLTLSLLGDLGVCIKGVLMPREGRGGITVTGNIWACLEMEDE